MSISRPQKESARGEFTSSGYRETVTLIVDYPNGNPDTILHDVIRTSGVPRLGDPHRAVPATKVVSVSAEPYAVDKYRVTLRYEVPSEDEAVDKTKPYGEVRWRGNLGLETESTKLDWEGNPMRVFYAGMPVFDVLDLQSGNRTSFQYRSFFRGARIATVDASRPVVELEATRWERDDPEQRVTRFAAKVNREQWRGYPPQTVLCNGASFEPDDAEGWNVTYSFTVKPRGWRFENAIVINNQTPVDATVGNGIAYHEVYEPISFAVLQL